MVPFITETDFWLKHHPRILIYDKWPGSQTTEHLANIHFKLM